MKNIWISVNNQKIKGTLFYPDIIKEKNPALIFIHGWASNENGYKPRAQALAKLGFICLTLDLRGHGQSDGKLEDFSISDHLNDVIMAYDYLILDDNVDKNKIGIVGASYGGYLASILSAKRDIKWLVLRAPAIYPSTAFNRSTVSVLQDETKFFNDMNLQNENNPTFHAILNFNGKIFLVESENDQIIPHKIIDNYINAVKNKNSLTYKVMKGASHDLSKEEWREEFIKIMVDWFKENLFNV